MIKYQASPDRRALSTLSNNVSNIPVSPTANLKLLTKVASELVSPVSVKAPTKNVSCKETDPKTRKEKSLGILCDRFLAMFPLNLPPDSQVVEICLDRVAEQLGIVKRRIYDIINILESLHMASKVAKNRYHWHGCNNLQATLSQLKAMALEYGIDEKLQDIQNKQKSGFRLVSGPTCYCWRDAEYSDTSVGADGAKSTPRTGDGFFSDERTLGVMCLKFIMLFLASPQSSARINLDLATRMLVSEAADPTEKHLWGMKVECHKGVTDKKCDSGSKICKCMLRLKTKVRRLYDIANVLTSLGLIAKIENPSNSMRKPVFAYTGPAVRLTAGQNSFSLKNYFSTPSFLEDEGVENKINVSHKRKDSKCNGGPPEKFLRVSSDNNLDISLGRCEASQNVSARHVSSAPSLHQELGRSQYQCSLADILHIAGQELEKIRSDEQFAAAQKVSNARKKLSFSRCHSDSCIKPAVVQEPAVTETQEPDHRLGTESVSAPEISPSSTTCQKSVCITLSDSKSKCFTITRKLVEVPVHVLPRKVTKDTPFNLRNITPKQAQTLTTLFGLSNQQVQTAGIKLDSHSLLPSATADIGNKKLVQPVSNVVVSNLNRTNISASSRGHISSPVAPGELYRAIKVGNVVRLVPFISTTVVNSFERK